MTLGEAFAVAHQDLQTSDPIAITLHPGGEHPDTIIEMLPVSLLR